jgi:hypothetical protein
MNWWFEKSPEAALVMAPIMAPGYYGARYIARKYAPGFGDDARRIWDATGPEEDAATAELLSPYRSALRPSQGRVSSQDLLDILNDDATANGNKRAPDWEVYDRGRKGRLTEKERRALKKFLRKIKNEQREQSKQ